MYVINLVVELLGVETLKKEIVTTCWGGCVACFVMMGVLFYSDARTCWLHQTRLKTEAGELQWKLKGYLCEVREEEGL